MKNRFILHSLTCLPAAVCSAAGTVLGAANSDREQTQPPCRKGLTVSSREGAGNPHLGNACCLPEILLGALVPLTLTPTVQLSLFYISVNRGPRR